jgi:G3E family GTPase
MSERIGAFLLTGFLGSGKTTLLQSVLQDSAFKDTAVIVNEFGKVGLDHDLISFSTESTVVMPGGCVCCTIREDIETSLRELFELRDSGRIPAFNRIVIETTGIAEPVPILLTLKANPLAQSRLEQPCVITVVDGVLGVETLKNFPEATAQVASADILWSSPRQISPSSGMLSTLVKLFAT